MIKNSLKLQLRRTSAELRNFLLLLLLCFFGFTPNAQDCLDSGFVPPDTLRISSDLGNCQITTKILLDSLGLDDCSDIQLIPSGPYDVPLNKSIAIYDIVQDEIHSLFYLSTSPKSLEGVSGVVIDSNFTTITIPLSAGECLATKDKILDQLNVPQEEILRSQIHIIADNARLTEFTIGDTISIDAIECKGSDFYTDIQLVFEPAISTFDGVMTFDIGLTTCKIDIDTILYRLGYQSESCDISRFSISDRGPFGYGTHRLEYIKLDDYYLLKDAVINVVASGCNIPNIDFDILPEGKCALNEYDIIDTLGFNNLESCGGENVRIFPEGPYETSPVLIERIEIDGEVICSDPFFVSFVRDEVANETGAIICHQDLNIAMGADCMVRMNADVILANGNYCYLNYNIELSFVDTPDDIIASGHEVLIDAPGAYSLVITNPSTGNSCWSNFIIEDKYIEDIRCVPDTLWCYESLDLVPDDTIGGGPEFPDIGDGSTFTFTGSVNHYTVSSATLCGVAFAHYEDDLVDDCTSDNFKQIIDRLWTFEDNYGNVDTCTQRLYIKNSTLDLVDNFVTFEADCLAEFDMLDPGGNPSPDTTGYPTINGFYKAGICGTLKMNYSDSEFPLCGLGKKILRRWVIIDWCSDQVMELTQVIRIEDKKAPEISTPLEDLSIDSDPYICGGTNIDLPLPSFDDCNLDEVILEVIYETYDDNGNLVKRSNGSSLFIDEIKTLDIVSTFEVEYILSDPCGNEARDTLLLTISDTEPPVAVCDEFTVISVGGNGNALVRAETFDDLSVDNCGIQKFEVRKLEGFCDVSEDFTPDIRFCCEEVGDTIMVEFKVTDLAGNVNFCEVRVNIQDKFRPIITCPEDVAIDCGVDFLDLEITGRPESRDNCGIINTYFVDDEDIGQCYQGTIRRTWMVEDRGGFIVSCEQIITIMEDSVFTLADVLFPSDTIIMGCNSSLDPEFTGKPQIIRSSCSMVDATHEDLSFYDAENACIKILREWTIIDWCQRDEENSGIWKKDQIIKLVSDIGPEFQFELIDTSYCIFGNDCSENIQIRGFAEDGDGCTPPEDILWTSRLYTTEDALLQSNSSAIISANLEKGNYYILYEAVDGCDNTSIDTFYFEVIDCSAPLISCPAVQPSLVLDPTGLATLKVEDVVGVELSDNCDESDDIGLSFDKDNLLTELNYLCEDLENGISDRFVKIFAFDQSGNVDSCELFLQIRDNSSNLCAVFPDKDTLSVSGLISTQELSAVEGVDISLHSPQGVRTMTTNETGIYEFDRLAKGASYTVAFEKNTKHDDGVTTLDILLTQRHILSLKRFESPYQVIAADADNNGKISAIDLVRMRRLVLGIDSEFGANNQKSWRFVDAEQTFEQNSAPFPFIENIKVDALQNSMNNVDFMAIKIGDVNGSNSVSSLLQARSRSVGSLVHIVNSNGGLDFVATEDDLLNGLQLTFEDIEMQNSISIEKGILDISTEHYFYNDNKLAVSWITSESPIEIKAGDVLFSVLSEDVNLLKKLLTHHETLKSEWINRDMKSSAIHLSEHNPKLLELKSIQNIKNTPNPFLDYTNVSFDLMQDASVKMELIDLSGKRIFINEKDLPKGQHSFHLSSGEYQLNAGIYILKINAGTDQYVHKITFVQ